MFLDLMMPKVHGTDILRIIKSNPQTRQIGVIVYTSKNFLTEQRRAEELGAFGFIMKPIEMENLLTTVERFFVPIKDGVQGIASTQAVAATVDEFHPILEMFQNHFHLWGTRGSIPGS